MPLPPLLGEGSPHLPLLLHAVRGSSHCLGGSPSVASWSGVPPPSVSCMSYAERARCLGGTTSFSSCFAPTPPPFPARDTLGVPAAWGVPLHCPPGSGVPPLPLLNVVRKVRTLPFGGGSSLSSALRIRAVAAHGLLGVAPSLPCPRAGCARFWVEGPPSSSVPWPRARGARCHVWGSSLNP